MTTPTGPISLADVQTEFGGSNPISLSEYYRGGANVPAGTAAGTSGVQIATSGAIRLGDFRGVTKAAPVNPLPLVTLSETEFGGPASASVTFADDGVAGIAGGGSTIGGSNWFLPTTAGIGSSYWIRFTLDSGTNHTSGPVNGSWHSLSADVTWAWTRSSPGSYSASFTIDIASDSGGSNIVATRSGNTAFVEWA